jgi:hypothetical protein
MLAVAVYSPSFPGLITAAPVLAACGVGVVLALVNWRRAPRAAPLVLAAAVLIAAEFAGRFLALTVILPDLNRQGMSSGQVSLVATFVGLAGAAVHAVALFLLYVAAFGGRPRAE